MAFQYPPLTNIPLLLQALHDVPATTDDAPNPMLVAIYTYLTTQDPNLPGDIHWFCDKADPIIKEAAAFLLRLHAYNSARVIEWKTILQKCISRCAPCAQGLEIGKAAWKSTYFAAFVPEVLEQFFTSFENWELEEVLKDIRSTTGSLPSGTLYRLMSIWNIFCHPATIAYLKGHVPPCPVPGWPEHPLPPGVLALLIASDTNLRTWAKNYASGSKLIHSDFLTGPPYIRVLEFITSSLENLSRAHPTSTVLQHMDLAGEMDLWSGVYTVIRLLPPEWLTSNGSVPLRLRRVILKHLRDSAPHFQEVFKCFILLMKRLGKGLWVGEGPEYPQAIFDDIKDNSHYVNILHTVQPSEAGANLFFWFPEFLSTLRDTPNYSSVFMKVIDFLSAETQRDGLDKNKSIIAKFLMTMLYTECKRLRNEPKTLNALEDALEAHAEVIVSVALSQQGESDDWRKAQERACGVIELTLEANVNHLKSTLGSLCEVLVRHNQGIEKPLPTFVIRKKMWGATFSALQSISNLQTSNQFLSKTIRIVSQISHIAQIRAQVFSKSWESKEGDQILKTINEALVAIQNGLSSSISAFADYGTPSKTLEILQAEEVGRSMTLLLLSPVQDLQTAAKTFIGLAFDVDGGRMECFRCLFENLPSETFIGMFQYLNTFSHFADTMPEACSLSAMLVLCFADILDVLCVSPDGLLHNSYFLKVDSADGPASRLLQFWKLLTHALSQIYKRTPMWAAHVDTPDMVIWMRDAVILARDVLKQWKVIECAASAYSKAPSKRGELSTVGKQMLDSLQEFLPQLVKWLRLTDEELLHQSFSLLVSVFDLMKEAHILPAQAVIEKLAKYVEAAKSGKNSDLQQKTRLDAGRLLELSQILDNLQQKDEEEVELISYTAPPKKKAAEIPKQEMKVHRPYIQGKGTQPKAQSRLSFPPAASTAPRKSSAKFTEKDQQTLDAAIPRASFRKPQPIASGSSRALSEEQSSRNKIVARNESVSRSAATSENSDSDDSDEDEDEDDPNAPTLDDLAKIPSSKKPLIPKLPTIKQPTERRQIKMMETPASLRLQAEKVEREKQRNAALRMKPDISGLHKILLSWDYNHSGSSPPGPPLNLVQVPDRFDNHDHYFRVFQPLLLMECWAQISQTKDEMRDSYQCKVESRQYVDSWLDLDLVISETVKKDWYLAETDVVLIQHNGLDKCIMAKVKQYRALMSGIQTTVRCFLQGSPGDPGLQIGTAWKLSKLFSLSTLHREYAALMSLKYNDICPFIMQPKLQKAPDVVSRDLQETMNAYRVNEPQATAILKAMETNGFSLIQGPPGTGKTSTICGLITRFLAKRQRAVIKIVPGQATGYGSKKAQASEAPTARILVCAPSNAAIDELAQRIRDGHAGANQKNVINIVRIGPEQTLSPSIRDISLDYLVDRKLDDTPKPFGDISNEIKSIRQEIETVKGSWKAKREEMDACAINTARFMTLENEVKALNSKKQALINKLDSKKDKQKSDSRTLDTIRRNTRNQILLQADIICSTLTGAGHESLESLEFSMIIIDEAAQAIELSSLIPLKYGCSRCVMVGDPQQLPPTVISPEATRFGYNQSLFVRLQRSNQDAVHLLSIQYRMHPDISRLPSKVFYDGRLLDGPDMAVKTKQLWHAHDKFGTYKFLNVSWGVEESVGRSLSNPAECKMAADLFNRLRGDFTNVNFDYRIGIVSMYKAQINALRNLFVQRFGAEIIRKVTFNTVDGFQGQEKDIIILSCVRAGPGLQRIGFTADIRRMNVALTRAKSSLFILGNAATLERSDDTWRVIVQDARTRESLITVDVAYFAQSGPRPIISTTEPMRKKRKVEATQATPAIHGLLTAQEFKSAVHGLLTPQEFKAAVHPASTPPRVTKRPTGDTDAPVSSNTEAAPRNAGQPSTSTSSSNSNQPPRNPAQPSRKRPKQQTMFIPTKKRTL
ncbi:hypothetical protein BDN70DRAFT_870734 [Pholiota conissans]|uniref:Senataxin n=1 Tax=Pholiota conissans TaxID=109636 RepID=A0A9P5ZE95_9AGAR|nr:hypothetical protein BDN70DRAFT_870734 [Pholiota conissans]